jgi:ParB family chromosome partitioning protein
VAHFQLVERIESIQSIPLSQLQPSAHNVRTVDTNVDALEASIRAHGLRQNLNVAKVGNHFEVVAGGRRLRALRNLASAGAIAENHPIPCIVIEQEEADEASLAENVVREAMHPADEFVAYNELATRDENPLDPAEIAARYGCSELHVKQRLKLANVAPKLIAEYRAEKATLEQLIALAITDDHAEQVRVWTAANHEWQREPRNLRQALTKKTLPPTDPVVKYVGVAAYEKAGGQVRKDLFASEADGGYVEDPKLLRELALQKLNKRADQLLREGWLWTEARIDFDYDDRRKFQQENPVYTSGKPTWPEAMRAYSGCVVHLDAHTGKTDVTYGLVRPGDKKAHAAKAPKSAVAKKVKKNDALPFASAQRLQGFRTAVARVELVKDPKRALAALAAALLDCGHGCDRAVKIDVGHDWTSRPDRPVQEGLDDAEHSQQLEALSDQFGEVLNKGTKNGAISTFEWLLGEPIETSIKALALAAGEQVLLAQKADTTTSKREDDGAIFAALAGIDFANHWTVSEAWLQQQPTAYILKSVADACGKKEAARLAKIKGKAPLAKAAFDLLSEDPGGSTWLPEPLRTPVLKAPKIAKAAAKK